MNYLSINRYKILLYNIVIFKGVWFLTAGLNSGVSKVIGQSIWRYSLLSEKPTNHTIIGLTSWGCLSDKTHDVLRRQVGIFR